MRKIISVFGALCVVASLAVTTQAASAAPAGEPASTLYFSRDNLSELYTIDVSTGVGTLVGTTGVTSSTVGLTPGANDGELIGSTWTDLSTIQADGSGHTVAGTGDLQAEGLAYDRTNGVLYGALNGDFFTADATTGARIDSLTDPGADVEGLAWHDGQIYGLADDGTLRVYDIATDVWSEVGPTGLANTNSAGLAHDPNFDVLYSINGDGDVASIDPTTGAGTAIGNVGFGAGGGLAFVAAPPPDGTLVAGEPTGDAGGDVEFPVSGNCGDVAGNTVTVSIAGPGGVTGGPIEATTTDDGSYTAVIPVEAAPAGDYTITGTCEGPNGSIDLPEIPVVLSAAEEPDPEPEPSSEESPAAPAAQPVAASPTFTG